jgi:hypothetical protein
MQTLEPTAVAFVRENRPGICTKVHSALLCHPPFTRLLLARLQPATQMFAKNFFAFRWQRHPATWTRPSFLHSRPPPPPPPPPLRSLRPPVASSPPAFTSPPAQNSAAIGSRNFPSSPPPLPSTPALHPCPSPHSSSHPFLLVADILFILSSATGKTPPPSSILPPISPPPLQRLLRIRRQPLRHLP